MKSLHLIVISSQAYWLLLGGFCDIKALPRVELTLRGAGTNEINGQYRYVELLNGAAYFERRGDGLNANNRRFTIYKCFVGPTVSSYQHRWYISSTIYGQIPLSEGAKDIDYYGTSGDSLSTTEILPLMVEWECCGDNGELPLPQIQCHLST